MKKVFFLFSILFFASCDPFDAVIEDDDETTTTYQAELLTTPIAISDSLNIASWNVKFAGGRLDFFFDCFDNRSLMTEEEVLTHLAGLGKQIRQMNPDIIFLQEVDVSAKRSAYIDQVQWLLDNTDLNYGVYASQWKADYVASDGIGKINSGNAILSKYPLGDANRIALPLIEEQSGLVQYFYLRRNVLEASIQDNQGKKIMLLGTHTSAFAKDGTKEKQLIAIKERIDELNTTSTSFVLGGDFNSLPPNSVELQIFADDVCPKDSDFSANDFSQEGDIMLPFYEYEALIPLADYTANNANYFSFTADKDGFWNRKLDYIFTNATFNNGLVHMDESRGGTATMPLSDHAPLSGILTNW